MKAILTYFYYIISDPAKMWKLPITLAVLCIAGNLCQIDLLHIQLINLFSICIITFYYFIISLF